MGRIEEGSSIFLIPHEMGRNPCESDSSFTRDSPSFHSPHALDSPGTGQRAGIVLIPSSPTEE